MSHASKTSQGEPKIPNKVDKQKFDFIFKRSVFRYMCAFFKQKFVGFTNGKKVTQKKLLSKTIEFIEANAEANQVTGLRGVLDGITDDEMRQNVKDALIAVVHVNKHKNQHLSHLKHWFSLIRQVTESYNSAAEEAFQNSDVLSLIFLIFASNPEHQEFIQKQMMSNVKNQFILDSEDQ